jgi:hypothetical protein
MDNQDFQYGYGDIQINEDVEYDTFLLDSDLYEEDEKSEVPFAHSHFDGYTL